MKKTKTNPNHDKAIALFKHGISGNNVAKQLGLKPGTVRTWLWAWNKSEKKNVGNSPNEA